MAIVGNTEWKYESAWIHALGKSADISVPIRRATDQTNQLVLPAIVVECYTVMDPTGGKPDGYDAAHVMLKAQSYKDDDLDGQVAENLIGAIRDMTRHGSILSYLEEVGGIAISNILQDNESFRDNVTMLRQRGITMVTIGSLVYY